MGMVVVWSVLAVLFLVIELLTVGMVTMWFLGGALVAMLAAILNAALWLQIVLFIATSVVFFLIFYPLMKRLVRKNKQATNADRVIGQICVVVRGINNVDGTGAVTVDGRIWTARTENDERMEKGEYAEVVDIQGVKLIVRPTDYVPPSPEDEEPEAPDFDGADPTS